MAAGRHQSLEQLAREFLQTEIESGLTFVRLAATAYTLRERAHGDALLVKAEQAAAEVARWLHDAEMRGWAVSDLRGDARGLYTALVKLRPLSQQAA